jgi:hypothetical protein
MDMSISPAQLNLEFGGSERSQAPGRGSPTSDPAVAVSAKSAAPSPSEHPVPIISPAPLSTDMRIDEEHQVYYQVVNDRTGDVLLEIPSEALRQIGESIKVPLDEAA